MFVARSVYTLDKSDLNYIHIGEYVVVRFQIEKIYFDCSMNI